jgi:uncharacterized protein with PIN domain
MDPAPKFIVDNNVGRLAKWLRVLGFDTLFINPIADEDLLEIARREGRIIVTKDTAFLRRREVIDGRLRVVFVRSNDRFGQLREVIGALNLPAPDRWFSRCLACNAPLEAVAKAEVAGQVPPYVYATHNGFQRCSNCGRVYWPGTHWERMRAELQTVMARPQ